MRWQNQLSGILGLWIILVAFLGFSSTLTTFFLVVTGLSIAALGFWSASLAKSAQKSPSESEISPPPSVLPSRGETAEQTVENDSGSEISSQNTSQNNVLQDF